WTARAGDPGGIGLQDPRTPVTLEIRRKTVVRETESAGSPDSQENRLLDSLQHALRLLVVVGDDGQFHQVVDDTREINRVEVDLRLRQLRRDRGELAGAVLEHHLYDLAWGKADPGAQQRRPRRFHIVGDDADQDVVVDREPGDGFEVDTVARQGGGDSTQLAGSVGELDGEISHGDLHVGRLRDVMVLGSHA